MKLFGRIGRRLLRWFMLVALMPLLFMGYQGYFSAKQAVEREVFLHMEAVTMAKRRAIEQWFRERQDDLRVLATNPQLVQSLRGYTLQGRDADLASIHEVLTAYQEQSLSYAFMCLHGADLKQISCTMGGAPFTMSDLGHSGVFQQALKSESPVLSPIYLQRGLGPGMHVAAVVRDAKGQALGILVATLALAHTLNPIILDTTGLGSTGQAYLVDTAKVMLTPSRFMNHPDPLTHTMDSEGIRAALKGTGGTAIYEGFEGQQVMGAWEFMPEQRWALIAEIDADEALMPLAILRRNAIIVALITLAAILLVVGWVSRSISLPVQRLAEASLAVSQGDLDRRVIVNTRDELAALADRFNLMVASLRDSQRQVVQSERLAAIGELVASVVHEIRNPLSAIKMNLRILEHKYEGTSPVVIEHFELARTQMEKLEAMLRELLDYSKPIQLHKRAVPVRELVDDALRHVPEGITVEKKLADPGRTVAVDPEKMEQVLLNLLLNAQQAIPDGGRITISSGVVEGNGRPIVTLAVRDTGQGISAENLRHIFEPFFTTRKHGTGLGLPNAKKVVEAHGGQIEVHSEINKGTEVRVVLPA